MYNKKNTNTKTHNLCGAHMCTKKNLKKKVLTALRTFWWNLTLHCRYKSPSRVRQTHPQVGGTKFTTPPPARLGSITPSGGGAGLISTGRRNHSTEALSQRSLQHLRPEGGGNKETEARLVLVLTPSPLIAVMSSGPLWRRSTLD